MLRATASQALRLGRARGSGLSSSRLPRQLQQQQRQPRRSFHVESHYSPAEEIMLDCTAWIVAGTLCFTPIHEFDDLDCQNMADMQEEATKREEMDKSEKSNHKPSSSSSSS